MYGSKTKSTPLCFQIFVFTVLGMALTKNLWAESSTPWIFIDSEKRSETQSLSGVGTQYLTLQIKHTRINHRVNWWNQFIGKNKKAVVSFELNVNSPNGSLKDRRTSPPIEILERNKPIDLGWKKVMVNMLPTTFKSIEMNVNVGVTAEDGMENLLIASSEISSKIPGLTMSQAALGGISAAKMVADFIFDKKLVVNQITSSQEIISSVDSGIKEGFYTVLSADTADLYSKYTEKKELLSWDGSILNFNGKPIEDVSYYIVEIEYTDEIFKDKFNGPLSIRKPWRDLYALAIQEVEKLEKETWDDGRNEIKRQVQNAHAILDADFDLIHSEKEGIHNTIREEIISQMKMRHAEVNKENPDPFFLGSEEKKSYFDIGP